jgi:hypothetical protein
MSNSRLIRLSGLASIASGVLLASFFILHPGGGDPASAATITSSAYAAEHLLGVASMALMLLASVGLYARQLAPSGTLGLVSIVIAFLGTALTGSTIYVDGFMLPIVAANAPDLLAISGPIYSPPGVLLFALPGVLFTVGLVLFGVASLRARVLPRWGSVLLMVGAVILALPPEPLSPVPAFAIILGAVVFAAGLAWLGLGLWSRSGTTLPSQAPAAPDIRPVTAP